MVTGVVIGIRDGRIGVRLLAGTRDFSAVQNVHSGSRSPPSFIFCGYGGPSTGLKRTGREVEH